MSFVLDYFNDHDHRKIDFFREDLGIRLLHDHIIARRDPAPEQIGSIVLPGMGDKSETDMKAQTAVVLAVGPGKKMPRLDMVLYPDVWPGDRIAFSRYTGGDVPGHEGCIIMRESDVLAVIG